jgi:glycosyltransferase involved in cell wall biosynthesis
MSDLISIITGFYNRGNLVRTSIGSLLRQTYTNLEIIVFDDCSTDHTYEELLKFQDPRLKVIRHSINIGFVNGLINAIEQSSGDYIAIHGSGDVSYPTRLEKQYRLLKDDRDLSAVGCNVFDCDMSPGGNIYRRTRVCDHPDTFQYSLINGRNCFTGGEVMIRKYHYDRIGGYRKAFYYAQDRDLWLRLIEISKLGFVDEVLYKRLFISNSIRFNIDKILIQRRYSELARQCAEMRLDNQCDLVDLYGQDAINFLSKSKRLSDFYKNFFETYQYRDTALANRCYDLYINS